MTARGVLIVLEGLDGAGTTTQARRLASALTADGHRCHVTREPSDGPIGQLLRAMLTGQHAVAGGVLDPSMFSLLFAADRMDHLQREVEPALAEGTVVISDRWYHSSLAYQGTDAAREWIRTLNKNARVPDLTLLLRVDANVAAERRRAAERTEELFEKIEMQKRVARGYDTVMADLSAAGEPIAILDGEQPIEDVTGELVTRCQALWR